MLTRADLFSGEYQISSNQYIGFFLLYFTHDKHIYNLNPFVFLLQLLAFQILQR